MGRKTVEVNPGDIFMIPLFLPSNPMDEYNLNYSKYKFHMNDVYGFGRLIEIQAGNVDLIEVFSYVGQIPENPEKIICWEMGMIGKGLHQRLWKSRE